MQGERFGGGIDCTKITNQWLGYFCVDQSEEMGLETEMNFRQKSFRLAFCPQTHESGGVKDDR